MAPYTTAFTVESAHKKVFNRLTIRETRNLNDSLEIKEKIKIKGKILQTGIDIILLKCPS